jgi:hypothetical protein
MRHIRCGCRADDTFYAKDNSYPVRRCHIQRGSALKGDGEKQRQGSHPSHGAILRQAGCEFSWHLSRLLSE